MLESSCPKGRSSSITGLCSRVSERWTVRLTDWCSICSDAVVVNLSWWITSSGEELKGKALEIPLDQCSYPHLWSWTLGNVWKNKIVDTSGLFWACPNGGRPQGRPSTCWRDHVSQLAWEHLEIPLDESVEEVIGAKEVQVTLAKLWLYSYLYLLYFLFTPIAQSR